LNPEDNFSELRKMLSNFYVSPFILDENTWNSVEHFFHVVKFRNGVKEMSKLSTELLSKFLND